MPALNTMFHKTLQYRGYMSRLGHSHLDWVLGDLCSLGNAAIQERREAWKLERKPISFFDQCKSLTGIRGDDPDGFGELAVHVARGALRRVDRAFQSFFRRVKRREKAGYPRFRPKSRYESIEIEDVKPGMIRRSVGRTKIKVKGLPKITLRHEVPDQKPRSIRIVRRPSGCTVDLVYEFDPDPLPASSAIEGLDLGVRRRVTLSTGEVIERRRDEKTEIRIRGVSRGYQEPRRDPGPGGSGYSS